MALEQPETPVKRPAHRPDEYTQEKADNICAQIACGYSLRTISKEENMPSVVTMFAWLKKYPEFLNQYALAKEEQADALAEDILDIADDGSNDWLEINRGDDEEGVGWRVNGEAIQRSRLRVDTRKWLAGKLKAKKYGDSTTLKGDKENPLIGIDSLYAAIAGKTEGLPTDETN